MPGFLSQRSREMEPHLEMRKENRALLELWLDPLFSCRVETGMSGNSLSCIEGVKDPFEAQEGRWDFSRDATAEVFLYLQQETWGSS